MGSPEIREGTSVVQRIRPFDSSERPVVLGRGGREFALAGVAIVRVPTRIRFTYGGDCSSEDDTCSHTLEKLDLVEVVQVTVSYRDERRAADDDDPGQSLTFNFPLDTLPKERLGQLRRLSPRRWGADRFADQRQRRRLAQRLFSLRVTRQRRQVRVIDQERSLLCGASEDCDDDIRWIRVWRCVPVISVLARRPQRSSFVGSARRISESSP